MLTIQPAPARAPDNAVPRQRSARSAVLGGVLGGERQHLADVPAGVVVVEDRVVQGVPAARRAVHAQQLGGRRNRVVGSITLGLPVWPNPSIPQLAQVAGMNCMGPRAPALDGPSFVPSALSIWPIAARTVHDRPGQYRAADARNSCR